MANKPFRSLSFVIFSWCFLGFCQGQGGVGSGGGGNPPSCLAKLLPCQQFLQSSKAPEASCCAPLKDLVENNAKCLCDVFENPVIMKGLNVTPDDALKLAKTCGANVATSLCKTAAAPTVSPATHTHSNSSTTDHTASAPAKNTAASLVSHFGGSLSFAFFLGLLISVF